uniref:Uncharacterized protein n=1 Tax=Bubo bubo TaxID=30461 RepID=A0A8C0FR06_BUBBB
MVLLVPMLFGIQALYFCAASPPTRKAPTALLSLTCDDTAVEEAADLALRQISADQKERATYLVSTEFSMSENILR